MTGRNTKGGASAPPASPVRAHLEPLDPEQRWREFEEKTAAVAEAMRRALNLDPDVDLASYAGRYAMAAMSGGDTTQWRPPGPTEQALKSELLRVERAAKSRLKNRKDSDRGLAKAIKAMSRDGQRALPEALFIVAELPDPAPERLERLARNAAAAARVIPLAGKHPGGRRPSHARADALAVLLAQDFTMLTEKQPSASRRDVSSPELFAKPEFVALVEAVFSVIGMVGVSRKSAERALGRSTKSRCRLQPEMQTNKRT